MPDPKAISATELQRFLGHIDSIGEQLRPARRPQDRGAAECSRQEIRALHAIGVQTQITMSEVAATIGVTLSTANHTIGKLVAKGLVERTRDKEDRRVVRVKFSRKGKNIHKYVVEARLGLSRAILVRLDPTTRTQLLGSLALLAGVDLIAGIPAAGKPKRSAKS